MRKSIILSTFVALVGVIGIVATTSDVQATSNTSCLNGDIRQDFVIDWSADKRSGTVRTKDNRPLCKDAPLKVSTFTLPANYNDRGWWLSDENRVNPTAVPQQHYATESFVMKKGTNANIKFTTPLNPQCGRAVQIDAYVGNTEIKQIVGKGGIEDKIIQGSITRNAACGSGSTPKPTPKPEPKPVVKDIKVCNLDKKTVTTIKENTFDKVKQSKNLKDCEKTEAPVTPVTPVTPETPEKPAPAAPVTVLPETGSSILSAGIALSTVVMSAVAYLRSRQ